MCNDTKCRVRYSRAYTPLLIDMIPNNVYPGAKIQYNLLLRYVLSNIAADQMPVDEMKLGSTNVDFSELEEDYRPNGWRYSYFEGVVS